MLSSICPFSQPASLTLSADCTHTCKILFGGSSCSCTALGIRVRICIRRNMHAVKYSNAGLGALSVAQCITVKCYKELFLCCILNKTNKKTVQCITVGLANNMTRSMGINFIIQYERIAYDWLLKVIVPPEKNIQLWYKLVRNILLLLVV